MGLMDKMKAQATQIAEKAQEAGKVGQAKLEAVQARRKADSLLSELGAIAFESRTGRGAPGDERRAELLVEQLRQYEAEYGSLDGHGDGEGSVAGTAPVGADDDMPRSTHEGGGL